MTGGIYYFVIVNKFDEPIYEVDVKTPTTKDEKVLEISYYSVLITKTDN